jgi:hypothetical protein
MPAVNTRKEIAASEKAANAAHRKVNPQPTAKVKDAEQELLELRRKVANLEKRLSTGAGAKEFLVESPILHDAAAWAELNKGSNARLLRSFMMPSYLQVHAQPMVEAKTGRVKHIRGGAVELIGGRGEFDGEDQARYLSLNYPDYIISRRQADGSYKRFAVVLPAQEAARRGSDEEFYYDELPQTARTLAAANPNATVVPVEAAQGTLIVPTQAGSGHFRHVTNVPENAFTPPTRPQAQMPQAVKDRLAAQAQEADAPSAVLTAV